jgi:predicted  nucleic acid-binding Zn-ribbon protein
MAEITNELLYEVLKKIQADVGHIRNRVDDHDSQFIALREQLHNMQGELLRSERQTASVSYRLERIEARLGLADA